MISLSIGGISVTYNCYNLKYSIVPFPFRRKCPDHATDKCKTCEYGKAEMSASDATKLLRYYQRRHESNKGGIT